MPNIIVTSFYAALLGLLFIILSLRVISARRRSGVAIGVGPEGSLERPARVHANFAEYAPLALLLILLGELAGFAGWIVHLLAAAFTVGRAVHAYGVSQAKEDFRLRVSGMALTFTPIGAASCLLLIHQFRFLSGA